MNCPGFPPKSPHVVLELRSLSACRSGSLLPSTISRPPRYLPPSTRDMDDQSAHRVAPPLARDHAEHMRKLARVERSLQVQVLGPPIDLPPPPPAPAQHFNDPIDDPGPAAGSFPTGLEHIDSQPRNSTLNETESSSEVDRRPTMVSELPKFQRIFTGKRKCGNCDHRVKSPDNLPMIFPTKCITSQPVITMLHIACSACNTVYCRGCYRETRCKLTCLGEYPCPLLNPLPPYSKSSAHLIHVISPIQTFPHPPPIPVVSNSTIIF
ncbi:hypothetical protein BDN72DRAFT_577878 [Pluteus cervinus]|uniref:Uncharacterized protein n=1 Tax=Pluteus cervinus TaxID=181527 RepID=A0ACD3AW83_9AGAR|nr:hypothetical protein BDN72DRAFT_577878 [Pluteus cervinus]